MVTPIRDSEESYSADGRLWSMKRALGALPRHAWWERSHRRLVLLLVALTVSFKPACSERPAPGEDRSTKPSGTAPEALPVEGARKAVKAIPLHLIKVEAVDGTPTELRPDGLSINATEIIRQAAVAPGAFKLVPADSQDGCGLSASVVYALTANRKAVKATEIGEARVGIVGALHCQIGEEVTSFKADLERFESFGGPSDKSPPSSGAVLIKKLVAALAAELVEELVGKVSLRGATNAEVIATLETSTHAGRILEAALEAGERRLKTAEQHLVKLTAHKRPAIAMRSAAALGMLGASSDEVVAALVAMTRGADTEKHLVAVNTLSDLKNPIVVRYLKTIAEGHPEPAIRELAREGAKRASERLSEDKKAADDAPAGSSSK